MHAEGFLGISAPQYPQWKNCNNHAVMAFSSMGEVQAAMYVYTL